MHQNRCTAPGSLGSGEELRECTFEADGQGNKSDCNIAGMGHCNCPNVECKNIVSEAKKNTSCTTNKIAKGKVFLHSKRYENTKSNKESEVELACLRNLWAESLRKEHRTKFVIEKYHLFFAPSTLAQYNRSDNQLKKLLRK